MRNISPLVPFREESVTSNVFTTALVSKYGYGCISAKPVPESLTRVCVSLLVSFLGRPVAPP